MTAAAFLGGELSFGMQLGVKHTAVPIDAPAEFQSVLDAAALPAGDAQTIDLGGIPVLVTRDGHVVEGPATFGLAHFDTQIAGGAISLRAPAGS